MTTYQQQCLLAYLGYNVGPIDGILGNQTAAATQQFQRDYALEPTCTTDVTTQKMLLGAVAGTVDRKNVAAATASPAENVAAAEPERTTGTFWDRVRYFRREEFRCPCGKCSGYPVEPQEGIVMQAEALRDALGVPVTIIPIVGDPHGGGSGVRCASYNATFPNSVSNSRHLEGKAVDFSAPAPASKIEAWLNAQRNARKLRYWYRITNTSWHMDIE